MNAEPPDLERYLAQPSPIEPFLRSLFQDRNELVVFDVGACEGEDSIRYARLFPQARIFAFEPLPDNQALIKKNLSLHDAGRIELVPFALGDRAGEAVFHVSSGRPAVPFAGESWNYGNKSSSLLAPAAKEPMFGWISFNEDVTVPCTTLDSFCAGRGLFRIDFIHLDAQGAEHLVLAGGARILPSVGAIWLEVANQQVYQGQKLRPEIEGLMRERGFDLVFSENRGVEGDQFYVNRRTLGNRLWLARHRMRLAQLRVRGRLSAVSRRIGLYHPLHDLRRDYRLRRSAKKALLRWRRGGCPAPPPPAVKHACIREYARRHGLRILVETGTFYGDTLFALRRDFSRLFSIELSQALHAQARDSLAHIPQISLLQGDSAAQLAEVLPQLTQPALFWLDAHYSAGPSAHGARETPIEEELRVILRRPPGRDAILIDDARMFTGARDYPSLDHLRRVIAELRPQALLEVRDDIIRVHPV